MLRRLGKVFLLGVLVGLAIAVLRSLTRPAGRDDRPEAQIGRSLSPPPRPAATTGPTDAGSDEAPAAAPGATIEGDGFVAVEQAPPHDIELAPPHDLETTWLAPIDGQCPPGYPIKAKEGSRIFHQPGGLSYERTRPDRCYPTAEAAEADGFRAAKR